ncbi:MAG: type II toxin-antitoxin system VapC family toxin [Deltaproteobacteria bacterium]|nr:type II toxin-antitoxin system VapC family toxin [Deltaproteobacteria bacterium]
MAIRIAIDTNRYRDFCASNPVAVDRLQTAEQIFLPFIVLAELRAGFLCGTKTRQNESILSRFLNRQRVTVLYPTEMTTHQYAQLFFQLRRQGTPIPTNDIWIAALVVEHNLTLFSRDNHFDHLPQISRLD